MSGCCHANQVIHVTKKNVSMNKYETANSEIS